MIPKRQRLRPARQPAPYIGFEDRDEEDEDEAHFREIPEKDSFDYEVWENDTCPFSSFPHCALLPCLVCFNSLQAIKPFVAFGKETKEDKDSGDLGESSMKGLNFYQQYGQHDDRLGEILEVF